MSKSSEEVLLIVGHVRHRKTDGTLYLMGERMAWMQGSKSSFSVSHMYADIKTQKISPDSKDKVQLQLLMYDSSASTFHFNNPSGRKSQIQDRDGIKELLQQLLPKCRRKISSELEEKNRLLQEDPELFQLYKDLVVSQVINAEEFWASRASKLSGSSKSNQTQKTGVSAAFLADIKPQTDGCNGLKYNLTADIIESIFRTYPMVKKKHAEYVPHQMSESEFWTRFFQSHYFHRDRVSVGNKDMFSECAKTDEEEIQKEMNQKSSDPLLDLTKDYSIGEGYGGPSEDSRSSSNQTNLTIIRRFNQHSTMVLKACEDNTSKLGREDSTASGCSQNGSSSVSNGEIKKTHSATESEEPPNKKAKIREKLEYEDLQEKKSHKSVNLKLSRMERYLHGPTPVMATRYATSEDVLQAAQAVSQEINLWVPNLSQVLSGGTAVGVLGELSPGGALMQGTSQQELHQMVPRDIQDEIKQQYNALCELLRHFWACFPASSKFLEEKVVRMKSTLERFQMAKLNPLRDKLSQRHYTVNLTGHMAEMLNAAYNKFDAWQTKKLMKKS